MNMIILYFYVMVPQNISCSDRFEKKGLHMNYNFNFQKDIEKEEPAYWFIFQKDKIMTLAEGNATQPLLVRGRDIPHINLAKALHVGSLNGINCYAASDPAENRIEIPGTEWVPLRSPYGKFDDEMFLIYGRARQLLTWAENNRFCGRCGNPMALKPDERCFVCSSCGYVSFPRISPAVIVSVEKDGKLLLANAQRFHSKMYSVLAGFVEPGESLEDCVRREIKEETGLEVKNIRYFKSQPWPFPDSLMIAFTAEYAGGELSIDHREIDDAGWFAAEELPTIPGKISVARALIDHFVTEHAKQKC